MIKYPNGKRSTEIHKIKSSASNRGMSLEEDLNMTNKYYLDKEIAVIYKKPTPITIVNVDYKTRSKAKIVEAYFKLPSTTDYNGVYQGKAIDFEAKETSSKTSFPLSLIHKHQLNHLKAVDKQKAISFVIIRFTYYNETYLIKSKDLFKFIESNTRKSITYLWIKETGIRIPSGVYPPLDYLKTINIEDNHGK